MEPEILVVKGCGNACEHKPCPYGTCIEKYTSYQCNCTDTPFDGAYCSEGNFCIQLMLLILGRPIIVVASVIYRDQYTHYQYCFSCIIIAVHVIIIHLRNICIVCTDLYRSLGDLGSESCHCLDSARIRLVGNSSQPTSNV